jgi:twitching motility protein PilT
MEMIEILRTAVKQGASDVHLLIGRPPMTRLNGEMMELAGFDVLTAEESKRIIYSILYDEQKQNFEEKLNWIVLLPSRAGAVPRERVCFK